MARSLRQKSGKATHRDVSRSGPAPVDETAARPTGATQPGSSDVESPLPAETGSVGRLDWEKVEVEAEPAPSSRLHAVIVCAVGAVAGAAFWNAGLDQIFARPFSWQHAGLAVTAMLLLIGLERFIYGLELIVQTLRLQRRSAADLKRIDELLKR